MKDMDKIKQLINSQTAVNNCLALQFMQSLWHYSFEEALLTLELHKEAFGLYLIDLFDLKIRYFHDHDIILDYIYIRRTIHYKNELLKEHSQLIYEADPWGHQGVFKGLNDLEFKAISADLKQISPIIQALSKS